MPRRTHGEGSVYMRKDGRAAASAMYEGKRITKYGKNKTEAKQKLDAYLDDLKAGKVVIGPKQTVKQYLEHWLENARRLRIRVTTLQTYRAVMHAHLIPEFGHLQLDLLSRERVQAFYAELLDDGLAPRYIKSIHLVLSSALKDAVRDGVLARNVCDNVTLPRVSKYKAQLLDREECQRLIAAARGQRLWFFILMAITTGARRGELMALRWSDVDIESRLVHFHRTVARVAGLGDVENEPKTSSGLRSVRLSQVVIDGLEEHGKHVEHLRRVAGSRWVENNLLFPNSRGKHMNRHVVMRQFKRVLKKAGLPDMRFHDLRHSAATLLLAAGVSPKVIQEILGHSSITVTLDMYAHVMPNMHQEVADKMDDMFR